MKRIARAAAELLTWPVLVATLLGLAGDAWWVADLASHFRPQYLAGGALGLALAAFCRARWAMGAAAVALAVNLALVVPQYLGPAPEPGARLKLLVFNVNEDFGDPAAVRGLLARTDADVVALVEISERWMRELAPALGPWPHRVVATREDRFGLAVFSRPPITGVEEHPLGDARFPVLTVRLGELPLTVVHPPPPVSAELSAQRDALLRWMARRHEGRPWVFAGDLNATPWSASFAPLVDSGLSRGSVGVGATWPAPLGALGIPIDHVLVGGGVRVAEHEVLPHAGSDHLPLRVELVVDAPVGSAAQLDAHRR